MCPCRHHPNLPYFPHSIHPPVDINPNIHTLHTALSTWVPLTVLAIPFFSSILIDYSNFRFPCFQYNFSLGTKLDNCMGLTYLFWIHFCVLWTSNPKTDAMTELGKMNTLWKTELFSILNKMNRQLWHHHDPFTCPWHSYPCGYVIFLPNFYPIICFFHHWFCYFPSLVQLLILIRQLIPLMSQPFKLNNYKQNKNKILTFQPAMQWNSKQTKVF